MSTKKPTAAESAQWHRDRASVARHDSNVAFGEGQKRATADLDAIEAHHEAAAEALELLADTHEALLFGASMLHRDVLMRQSEKSDRAANRLREVAERILALVEGR